MMTLIAAAALAVQPAAPAPASPQAQPEVHMQTGQHADHKDCCKGMDGNHEGHGSEHAEHR